MDQTSRLALPYLLPNQAQKHVTHNEALRRLDALVHCGYEPTAVADTVSHPIKALKVWLKGVDTETPMIADIDLAKQRSAEYVFEKQVATRLF